MRKLFMAISIMAIMAVMTLSISSQVYAQDIMLDTKISQAVTKLDKNGNEYTRFIIQEARELNGVKYNTDVVVMAFGSIVAKAKTYAAGDMLKAVAGSSEYRGNLNYSIKAFVN